MLGEQEGGENMFLKNRATACIYEIIREVWSLFSRGREGREALPCPVWLLTSLTSVLSVASPPQPAFPPIASFSPLAFLFW